MGVLHDDLEAEAARLGLAEVTVGAGALAVSPDAAR